MNTWVRRSLQASLIAGGFVVLGAGVANAAEPVQQPDAGQVGQTSKKLAGDARDTAQGVDQVTRKAPADTAEKSQPKSAPDGAEQADSTAQATEATNEVTKAKKTASVTGEVDKAADGVAGKRNLSVKKNLPLEKRATPQRQSRSVAPEADVTRTADATDLVVTPTSTVDRTVPVTVDLGDLGNANGVTDVFGAADGMTEGNLDAHGLDGITSVTGVLDTASTLTAEVPGVVTVDGSSVTTSTADAVLEATAELSEGHLHGFGAATGMVDSISSLAVDAGDLGYLRATADAYGWLDGFGELAADLPSGDVWGMLAATSALDGVLTADGRVADLAGLSGVVTTSALLDGFAEAAGNLHDGELSGFAELYGTLDGMADGAGWIAGLGDWSFSSALSSVLDETDDLIEVSL